MKKSYFILFILLSVILISCKKPSGQVNLRNIFNNDWFFYYGELAGGENITLDDSDWRKVDLPHDWSIEDIPNTGSPFDSTVVKGVSSGFTRGGTGWYRKHFTLDKSESDRKHYILFEGVYMNSDIWINGNHLGNSYYGYSTFGYDITDFLKFGESNIIAVRVKTETVTSRWYSGAGIYRHVWLISTSRLHVDHYGTAITTPEVTPQKAKISVSSTLVNNTGKNVNPSIRVKILDAEKRVIAEARNECSIDNGKKAIVKHELAIENPALWSIESPVLYTLVTEIINNNEIADRTEEPFGIRSIQFDAQHGFLLNGESLKLKGGCIHHDNGPLGAKAYDCAEIRKIELLKSAGFNAIRTAHNPPSPALLRACDSLGMLVIDEAFDVWKYGHFENDYSARFSELWQTDLKRMIVRDLNHPSVIMWSIGNEIKNAETEEIAGIAKEMSDYVRLLDPTRPVTAGVNHISEKKDMFLSPLDVSGYNYLRDKYVSDHKKHPQRIMYGSESYAIEAYDYWRGVEENSWVIGDFVWTAFDYIGEASIGWRGYLQEMDFYPWNLAYCGDIDICGIRRPQSYYRQTLWDDKPLTYIAVSPPTPSFPLNPKKEDWSIWDWPDEIPCWNFEGNENKLLKVFVYTQCEEAELFLNGKTLGIRKNTESAKNRLMWEVPYQSGILEAKGFNKGQQVTTSTLQTAGEVATIKLSANKISLLANSQEISYISVELLDADGVLNTIADNKVTFTIEGEGDLIAAANSNPMSTESFQKYYRKAWRGQCMAIVKAGKQRGSVRLTARVEGLPEAKILIEVK